MSPIQAPTAELPLEAKKPSRMYVCRWEDGTTIAYASRACAESKSETCEVPPERIDTYRWVKPTMIYLACPQCGLPWGECA